MNTHVPRMIAASMLVAGLAACGATTVLPNATDGGVDGPRADAADAGPDVSCHVLCATLPPGCHYEGPETCSPPSCGTLVCTDAGPPSCVAPPAAGRSPPSTAVAA